MKRPVQPREMDGYPLAAGKRPAPAFRRFAPALGIALFLILSAAAGERPGPGLEVFDAGAAPDPGSGAVIQSPGDAMPYAGDPYAAQPGPTVRYDTTFDGNDFISAPYTDPLSGPGEPVAPAAASEGEPASPAEQAARAATTPFYPDDPVAATLAGLNVRNPHFPGLEAARQQGSLRAAADVIWPVLRQRRVIDAAMARGPGGSAGAVDRFELERALTAIDFATPDPLGADTPLRAANRIDAILDAFQRPAVDDYAFGGALDRALVRLYSDIHAVRYAIGETIDEGIAQELIRAYIRAVVTCDFFAFPRRDLVEDINQFIGTSALLFHPDGASRGGDVAGVTGNLFHNLLMLDAYTRNDNRFRRDISSVWRALERPARYVMDVACPDRTLPRYGARGSRELAPVDMARLETLFPPRARLISRAGLAASDSFPPQSNDKSYGGLYVMRSGREPDARYLSVRFGPYSAVEGVPGHMDFGSLTAMSRNIKFIVDPGGFGGAAAEPRTHSALSLDGNHAAPASYGVNGEPSAAVWRTNAGFDYAAGAAELSDGKTWQRSVLYVKDLPGESRADYWVVLDHVDMKGDGQPRRANIRFQLAPGLQAYHDGSGILVGTTWGDGSVLRIFAIDENSELSVSEGDLGLFPSHVFDAAGGSLAAPAVNLVRTLVGDTTTATVLYPGENSGHRPARIERDSDIIRGRTGALVIDHGRGRIDVIAWAPPGQELVTPTLNLQMSADLAIFRLRQGRIARMNFVNLERFQAKEPEGGMWSMRVNGPAQTITLEPEKDGGWQILSDPANIGSATFHEVNLGPAISNRRFSIRPGDMKVIPR